MKILFLNPPFLFKFSREQRSPAVTKSGTIYYPMWLAYAAGYAEKTGNEIFLIDCPADGLDVNDIKELLSQNKFKPALTVITTSTPSIYEDIKTTEFMKNEYPGSLAVLVGTHVSAIPKETFELSKQIDFIAAGEYDETIVELASAIEKDGNLDEVPGIFYRDGEIIKQTSPRKYLEKLDDLPFVSSIYKRFLNYRNYFYSANLYPVIALVTGRGCPYQCEYCLYPQTMHGHRFRKRSLNNVVDEIIYIKKNFPKVREIFFEDDTLTVDQPRVKEFCEMLINRKIKITWSTNSRAQVDFDTLRLMKQAGCRLLCVGYESGSQDILNNFNKNITLDEELEFSKAARKAGVKVHGCFILGYKGETAETIEQTINWAITLNPDTAQFFPLMVYPGTKAYSWAEQNNLIKSGNFRDWLTKEGLHNTVINSEQFSGEELVRFCDAARKKFYLRFSYFFKRILEGILHPKEGFRLAKAFFKFIRYLIRGSDV